jgi:hypothetical protein
LTLVALAALGSACGKSSSGSGSPGAFVNPTSGFAGLAFAVTDVSFGSSSWFYDDFATGEVRSLAAGESGDPWLASSGGKIYAFNRTGTSLNYRVLDPAAPEGAAQRATPGAKLGDPHALLGLGDGRTLLANNAAGEVTLADLGAGTATAHVGDALKPAGGSFHPELMTYRDVPGGKEIFVVHQGYDLAGAGGIDFNGTQAIYVLKDDGATLTPVDVDAAKDGLQGIPLTVSNPSLLSATADGKALIVGRCYGDPKCKAGVEEFDLATHATKLLVDFAELGITASFNETHGPNGQIHVLGMVGGKKVVVRVDPAAKTVTTVHEVSEANGGTFALLYDGASLYVGEVDDDKVHGYFAVYRDGATEPQRWETDGIPYVGAFVGKP